MRKDEEPMEESAPAPVAESRTERPRGRKAPKVVETDEVVEEGALLGEATLAKLSATRAPDDPASHAEKPEEKPAELKPEETQSTEPGQAE